MRSASLRPRLWAGLWLAALGALGPAGAQSGVPFTVTETLFLPPVYYVGDEVQMQLVLQLDREATVLVPEVLPETDWLLFRGIEARTQGLQVLLKINFISFAPGTRTLPRLVLGDLVLDNQRLYTANLLDGEVTELAPPRDQMVLPQTELTLALLALSLFGTPLGLWWLWGRSRGWWDHWRGIWGRRRAWRQFRQQLLQLRRQSLGLDARDFFTALDRSLRAWMGFKWQRDLTSLTFPELRSHLETLLPPPLAAVVLRALEAADQARYGGRDVEAEERLLLLDHLEAQWAAWEEAGHVDL